MTAEFVSDTFAEAAQPTPLPCPGLGRVRHHRHVEPRDSRDAYQQRHDRVRASRGRADRYRCVDCKDRAAEWSLRRDALGTLHCVAHRGQPMWISDSVWDYEPRCSGCHRVYDWETRLQERDEWERWLTPRPYEHDREFEVYR